MKRLISLSVLVCLMTGCAVKFPQAEMIMSSFETPQDPLSPYMWQLQIGEFSTEVFPFAAGKNTVFSDRKDGVVVFDGFVITKIESLNEQLRHIEFRDSANERNTVRRLWINYRPLTQWRCEPWRAVSNTISLQTCENEKQRFDNKRILNEAGQLVGLEQVIDEQQTLLKLYKNIQ